jgi:hypothetical protein
MKGGSWRVETAQWPIAVYAMEGAVTEEMLEGFLSEADAVLARNEPFVAIMDGSRAASTPAFVRQRSVEWQRANAAQLKAYCLGTAFVLSSAIQRFITMTVMMIVPLPMPVRIFETRKDALEWALGLVRPRS